MPFRELSFGGVSLRLCPFRIGHVAVHFEHQPTAAVLSEHGEASIHDDLATVAGLMS